MLDCNRTSPGSAFQRMPQTNPNMAHCPNVNLSTSTSTRGSGATAVGDVMRSNIPSISRPNIPGNFFSKCATAGSGEPHMKHFIADMRSYYNKTTRIFRVLQQPGFSSDDAVGEHLTTAASAAAPARPRPAKGTAGIGSINWPMTDRVRFIIELAHASMFTAIEKGMTEILGRGGHACLEACVGGCLSTALASPLCHLDCVTALHQHIYNLTSSGCGRVQSDFITERHFR